MLQFTPTLEESLRVTPVWLADRIRRSRDSQSLRRFACDVARATLAYLRVDGDDVRQALALAECADLENNAEENISRAKKLISQQWEQAESRDAELAETVEGNPALMHDSVRAHDIAAAYRTLVSCLWSDPLEAAVHVSYDASYSLGRLTDSELRNVLEPLARQIK